MQFEHRMGTQPSSDAFKVVKLLNESQLSLFSLSIVPLDFGHAFN